MKANKKVFFSIITTIITVLIFAVLFSKINFLSVVNIIKNANLLMLSVAILFSFAFTFVLIPLKWKLILDYIKCDISFKEAVFINVSAWPISMIMPFRSGDLIKSLYLKRQNKLSFKKATSTLVFDNAMDLFTLLFFTFLAFIFLSVQLPYKLYFLFSIMTLFLICVILIAKNIPSDFFYSFKVIPLNKTLFIFTLSSLGLFISFISTYFVFLSINVTIPFLKIMFYSTIIILITTLPITISGFGTREAAIIFFFSNYSTPETLLSAGILLSFTIVVLPSLVSLLFMKKFYNRLFTKNAKISI
jgi:uncharacterized membrane protein YbhN (UPF0104 family)